VLSECLPCAAEEPVVDDALVISSGASVGLGPSAKRRKLGPSGTQLTQQSSFADVLEQLTMDASQNGSCVSSRICF